MAEVWGAALIAGGALAGGVIASKGAKSAANTAAKGSDAAIAEQQRQFDLTRQDTAPYRAIGGQALNALGSIYGYQPSQSYFGAQGPSGTPFSVQLPQATVPGGSLNIGGQLTQKLGGLGKILDPAASIFGSKHGDERRNLSAFMQDNQLTDLGNGMVALPDGRTFGKDQLQQVAGAYYGARYHPDGNQQDWQQRYDAALSPAQGATPGANVGQTGVGQTSEGVQQGFALNPTAPAGQPASSMDPNAPNYGAFFQSPDYQFRKQQGTQGIGNSFSASGGAKSGNALKALAEFNSGLAAGGFNDYFNHNAALAGIGQTATGQSAQAGAYAGQGIGNALQNSANARASGIAGSANAWGGALGGVAQTLGDYLQQRRNPYASYSGGGFGPANVYGG